MSSKILPTITTTKDWRSLIKEANELGLKEVCFFPTAISKEERQEAYLLLEKSSIETIPFVHLRSDMGLDELSYLQEKFHTKIFNLHPYRDFPFLRELEKKEDCIFIETHYCGLTREDLENFAGVCMDVSHMEKMRLDDKELFSSVMDVCEGNKIGCWHVSAVRRDEETGEIIDKHTFLDLKEFDYASDFKNFLPPYVALEVENSISEQLSAINYLQKLLGVAN